MDKLERCKSWNCAPHAGPATKLNAKQQTKLAKLLARIFHESVLVLLLCGFDWRLGWIDSVISKSAHSAPFPPFDVSVFF